MGLKQPDEKERGCLLCDVGALGAGAGSCAPHVARVQGGIWESSEVVSKICIYKTYIINIYKFSSVQSLSCVRLFVTP